MKPDDVGSYLKQLRLERKLTQKELAGMLHITHQAVSNWEKGKALPDITILSQLGDIYGISIDNLLLKEETEDVPKPMFLRRFITFFGTIMSLYFISSFIYYDRHFVTTIFFVLFTLILSLIYSYILRQRIWWLEYLIITVILIVISLIIIPNNFKYYMMDETDYLIIHEEIPIEYYREFDELSHTVLYDHIFDTYVLIYTEGEPDINRINLSEFQDGEIRTFYTGNINIYDVLVYDNVIYFTTFNEEIPGQFQLFTLDFETYDITLIYESQEVLRMYEAFEQMYLVSDPFFEPVTKIYQYDFMTGNMSEPITVDYSIYGLSEYFVDYESYIIMSITNITPTDSSNDIVLADYNFDIQHTIYEEDPGLVHMLFSDYGHVLIGTEEGLIVFEDMEYYTLGDSYSRWPEIVGPDWIRNEQYLYQLNWDTDRFELYSDVPYYSEEMYEMGARFMVHVESEGQFFGIHNDVLELVGYNAREIDDVYIQSSVRLPLYIIGILSYGLFVVLGHKRK